MLQGKTSAIAFRVAKIPSWGVKTGMPNSPCSATRTELSSSTSTTSVGLPRSGKTTGDMSTEEDLKVLNQTGNLGKAVDVVIDYRTKETKSCYLSKDPVTNELFHMPVEQARIPRKVKDYTLSPKEYDAAVRGEEVPIRFKSNNGKFYATSIQMSAAERGVEFLWERSTKKLEEAQKQGRNKTEASSSPMHRYK